MTARSPIRYAHNGDAAIAYMQIGSGIDLLVIGGFVSHLEIVPSLPAAQQFWDRMGSFARVIWGEMHPPDPDFGCRSLRAVRVLGCPARPMGCAAGLLGLLRRGRWGVGEIDLEAERVKLPHQPIGLALGGHGDAGSNRRRGR